MAAGDPKPTGPWAQLASDLMSLRADVMIAQHDLGSSALSWYETDAIVSVSKYLRVAYQALDSACVILARPDVQAAADAA